MTAAALASAHQEGKRYGYPVVLYEWVDAMYDVCSLSLWLKIGEHRTNHLRARALVWRDEIRPLTLLQEAVL